MIHRADSSRPLTKVVSYRDWWWDLSTRRDRLRCAQDDQLSQLDCWSQARARCCPRVWVGAAAVTIVWLSHRRSLSNPYWKLEELCEFQDVQGAVGLLLTLTCSLSHEQKQINIIFHIKIFKSSTFVFFRCKLSRQVKLRRIVKSILILCLTDVRDRR